MIIGFQAEANLITHYIANNFNVTQVYYDNQKVPDKGDTNDWARISIQPDESKNLSLGNKAYRYFGFVFIQIFVRPGLGTSKSREIADTLNILFRDITLDSIRFKVPQLKVLDVIDGWHQSTFSVEFYREEF